MRLNGRTLLLLGAIVGLIVLASTDQIVPASSKYQAQMRIWMAARAAGVTAYLILTFIVAIGLILSHPVNKSTWKLSKRLFPWHENLLVFVIAFVVAHIVSLLLDPYAGVGILGSFIPGLSNYRSVPVAIGVLALYALLITGLTARYTKLLPPGMWLKIHRVSIVVWAASWAHGILAGTDLGALAPLYITTGLAILAAAAYRYWVSKQQRPTFATSLPEGRSQRETAPGPTPARTVTAAASGGDIDPNALASHPPGSNPGHDSPRVATGERA